MVHVMLTGPPRLAVDAALQGALRRIALPRCQQLLTDISDDEGAPLASRLAASGLTAAAYLANLRFVDGEVLQQCHADARRVAVTTRGSQVIHICGRRFSDVFQAQSADGEVVILHEFLHSLGLGENPPSSAEITRMVERQCSN